MLATLGLAVGVIVADQASKRLAEAWQSGRRRGSLPRTGVRLLPVINARRGWHSRTALRLRGVAWLVLVGAGLTVAGVTDTAAADVGVGAIIGGAAGNLVDGFRNRGVTDFIDLRVWPVFNLADTAIVAGACVTMWAVLPLVS